MNTTGNDIFGPQQISGSGPISYYTSSLLLSAGDAVFAAVDPKDGNGGDATGLSFGISLVCQGNYHKLCNAKTGAFRFLDCMSPGGVRTSTTFSFPTWEVVFWKGVHFPAILILKLLRP